MKQRAVDRLLSLLLLAWTGCGVETPSSPWPLTSGAGSIAAGAGTGGVGSPALQGGAGGSGAPIPVAGQGVAQAAGQGGSQSPNPPTAGAGGGFTPPEVAVRGSWPTFGGDLAHTRSSPNETMISPANVMGLKAAFDLKAPGVTATPALYKGVIYWADWGGIVHATNLLDQKDIWTLDRSAMGGGYTGSPAVTERFVYVANRNGLLSAIDRETGVPVWEKTLDAGVHTHIWSSPVVAEQDNVLVVGVGGLGTRDNSLPLPRSQLESFRGWVHGADATTGEELWRFQVTPAPNGAGVSVWSSAALDTTRKLAFIGTGNNYYRPVSEFSDSLLAIDYMTGQRKWHVQFTPNDAWTVASPIGGVDGDVGAAPNLFMIGERAVVGVGDKPGRYHVHDRDTGAKVWSVPLTSSNGFQGGVMAPAAYHDGVIYVISNNDTRSSTAFALRATDGSKLWDFDLTDPTFGAPAIGNGVLYVGDQAGNMWALDASSGQKLWEQRLPQGRGGGFSLVDGILFTGYGFHFSESRREPLMGGLMAFSLNGTIEPPTPTHMSDCMTDYVMTTAPTFTNVYQGVLCPQGCTKVCHSTSAEAGLNLEGKMIAYQGLVGVAAKGPACSTGGHVLVVQSNPAQSLLYGKLAATPACGVPMPPSATVGNPTITPAQLEVVRAWIAAGAPND